MNNLESAIQRIASGCLVYAVNTQTGELLPMTQDEYMHARIKQYDWIAYTDLRLALVHSTIVCTALRRWELVS